MVREWLEEHPRIEHSFIPKGAAWLNLIEAWWRLFPKTGFGRGGLRRQLRDRPGDEGRQLKVNRKAKGGCGDGTPNRRGIGGALLCTVFEERSTSWAPHCPWRAPPCDERTPVGEVEWTSFSLR